MIRVMLFISILFFSASITAQISSMKKVDKQPNFETCRDYKFPKDRAACKASTMKKILSKNSLPDMEPQAVLVEAQVSADGHIQSARVLDGATMSIRREAKRAVLAINSHEDRLLPAMSSGVAVACLDTFKIEFGRADFVKGSKKLQKQVSDDDLFKIVESMPRFPGCEDIGATNAEKKSCADKKMLQYVYKNLRYPAEDRIAGIQGQVVISFLVNKDGSISDAKILRDKGLGLGEEALRVVESFNDMDELWIPGRQRGLPVRVQYNLPVKFVLGIPTKKTKDE